MFNIRSLLMFTLILKTSIKLCSKFTHLKWAVKRKRSCYNGSRTHLRVHWGMPRCHALSHGGSPDPRPTEGGVRRGRSGDLWIGQGRYWKNGLILCMNQFDLSQDKTVILFCQAGDQADIISLIILRFSSLWKHVFCSISRPPLPDVAVT